MFASVHIIEFEWYEICIKSDNIAFMDLYKSKFKFWTWRTFMKNFDNIIKNEFDNLKNWKKVLLKLMVIVKIQMWIQKAVVFI